MSKVLAIDLGATNTRLALVNGKTGRIFDKRRLASQAGDYAATLRELSSAIATCPKIPVGVAVAGQLDQKRQVVCHAPNLKWHQVALARDLARLTGRKVVLENDVRAAARGELRFGALRKVAGTGVCFFWGSGIGGAVTHAGKIDYGAANLAGEIGHVPYRSRGTLCACGKHGCYEAYAGGHVLDRKARRLGLADARELSASARGGLVLRGAVEVAAQLIGCLGIALDPGCIVVGGSLGVAHFAELSAGANAQRLPVRTLPWLIVPTPLGDDAGLLGVAAAAAAA